MIFSVCFAQMVREDEQKFTLADEDGDGVLNTPEFSAFLHPYNHQRMHQLEITRTMTLHDKDGDGHIDFKEYLGEGSWDS